MSITKMKSLASGLAMGAAAVVVVAASADRSAANTQSLAGRAVNAPASVAPRAAPGSFADIVAKVAPAVVSIDVERKASPTTVDFGPGNPPFPFQFFGDPGGGDGQGESREFRWAFPQTPGAPRELGT